MAIDFQTTYGDLLPGDRLIHRADGQGPVETVQSNTRIGRDVWGPIYRLRTDQSALDFGGRTYVNVVALVPRDDGTFGAWEA